MPGGVLAPGAGYFMDLHFINRDGFAPAGWDGPTGHAFYDYTTRLDFTAAVPEPGQAVLAFGLMLGGWAGGDGGRRPERLR